MALCTVVALTACGGGPLLERSGPRGESVPSTTAPMETTTVSQTATDPPVTGSTQPPGETAPSNQPPGDTPGDPEVDVDLSSLDEVLADLDQAVSLVDLEEEEGDLP